jgi:signal transduction histidine kinase/phage shock protein PspC (stress-responsive transcriptional regulator)
MRDKANPAASLGTAAADALPTSDQADAATRAYGQLRADGPARPASVGPFPGGATASSAGPFRGRGPASSAAPVQADGPVQAGPVEAGPVHADGTTRPGTSWQSSRDEARSAGRPPAGQPGRISGLLSRLEALGLRVTRGPGSDGPMRREIDGSLLGGVAAGIAKRTGFEVGMVRTVIVIATLATSGFCAAAYVVGWLLIPAAGAKSSIGTRALTDKRGLGLAAGLTSILVLGLIIASALNAAWITSLAVPLIVCAVGLALIWRNAPQAELDVLRGLADPVAKTGSGTRSRRWLRILLALGLLLLGLAALLGGHDKSTQLLRPLGGILLLIGAIATALGPWWLRIARDLVAERQARIRAEERAEMASRVHDSVLQTLALIQRRAGDSHQVVQLARAQERELRAWLFDGQPPGSIEGQAATVAGAVRLIQQDIEAQHGMPVDAVTVGDCELDDDLTAMLAAAREATVNAAKWSDADVVSLFAEVEPDSVSLFVRDRGRGFDPAAVPGDRKGLAESVQARMARRGGAVTVRSAPGEGTEIGLTMPRCAERRRS